MSNSSLATAAMRTGLDRYIITKPFTGQKWRPPYNGRLVTDHPETRKMSTKILADVVEALIGVYLLMRTSPLIEYSSTVLILCLKVPHTLMAGRKKQLLYSRFSCPKYHGLQLYGQVRYCMGFTTFRFRYPLTSLKPKR